MKKFTPTEVLHSLFNPEATTRHATARLMTILLLLGLSLSQTATAQEWRTPTGWGSATYTNATLQATYFTSATTGYAVGQIGTILTTTDGGANWSGQTSGTTRELYSVYFPSATTGYAVGLSGTILKTTNGGTSWSAQTSGTSQGLYSVYFPSATTGYAVGNASTILKTTDGGTNWSEQTSGITQNLLGVYFTSATTGYAVGLGGTILSTTDGGTTWSAQTSGTTQTLNSVYFTSATTGYVVGVSGTILKTTNSGTSWSAQTSGTTVSLRSVYFPSATTGYAVGASGRILSTTNGGTSWSAQTSGSTQTLTSVYFTSATTGYAVGSGGTILKTTNGGTSWSAQMFGNTNLLNGVNFPSATTGYAVGAGGAILSTTNSGTSWSAQTSGTSQSLYSVYFPSATTGYAVGAGGTILKTTNSATSWSAQTSGTTQLLYGVYFPSATTGYAVGAGGTILKTTNGGTNWSAQTSGTTQDLRSVYFASATTGYAVGASGTILSTTNGGTSWLAQTAGTTQTLTSVYFPSATTGYAVGAGGTILKTTNGGTSWSAQTSGTTQILYSVYFPSATTGFAVGAAGTILSTTDGGTSWSAQTSGATVALYSVCFTSATAGYAVGFYGTVLLYKCLVPSITTQPTAASACAGTNPSFTVAATGLNLMYQWRKDGVDIPGASNASATTANLTLTSATVSNAGSYACVITNTCGVATSSAVMLTVNNKPNIAYSGVSAVYPTGTAITALNPINTGGTPTGSPLFAVTPALPTGLAFSTTTGAISGTPTAATANTTYTVTTQNSCGSTTTTVAFATPGANVIYSGSASCESFTINSVSGTSWYDIYGGNGIIASIRPNQNLGNVTVTVGDPAGTSTYDSKQFIGRNINFTSTIAPTTNYDMKLYYYDTEFDGYKTAIAQSAATLADLNMAWAEGGTGCDLATYASSATQNGTIAKADVGEIEFGTGNNGFALQFSLNHFTMFAPTVISAGALPVKLLYFTGKTIDKTNVLTWATANEQNNAGFEVERSTDGVYFSSIGFVRGADNSTTQKDYTFTDNKIAIYCGSSTTTTYCGSTYYRLKQTDFDGKYEYSNIVTLGSNTDATVSVYPNPSTGVFTIDGKGWSGQATTAVLSNSLGQTYTVAINGNQINLTEFPAGVYFLRLQLGERARVIRLVKL